MPGIRIKEHENFETALRRFKRAVEKSGILSEMRKREHYQPPSDKRKRALAAAVKRFRKKQQRDVRNDRGGRRSLRTSSERLIANANAVRRNDSENTANE